MSALSWRARLRLLLGGKLLVRVTAAIAHVTVEVSIRGPWPWREDITAASIGRHAVNGERRRAPVSTGIRAVGAHS